MFSPISLSEMDEVKLMKRMDTKFIVNTKYIPDLLHSLSQDYRILEIGGNRLMTYDSLYYDTTNLKFYLDHHNKRTNRLKIRKRNYVESGITFLEIKQKDNKGITNKYRIPLDDYTSNLSENGMSFVTKITRQGLDLKQTITNRFNRLTLVGNNRQERVTIDFNLTYNGNSFNNRLAIIELKQEKLDRSSPLFRQLKVRNIHPYSISKYCIGMATTHPELKQNYFKRKIQTIKKKTA